MSNRHTLRHLETLESRNLLTAIVDIDSDGDVDVVTKTMLLRNVDGFGNFEETLFDANSKAVAVGDLDNDGDADVVLADRWLENTDGRGDLSTEHILDLGGFSPTHVRLQDVGPDGDLDIVFRDKDSALLAVNTDGQFAMQGIFEIDGLVDAGDMDNDGDLDLLTLDYDNVRSVNLHLNNGSGQFEKMNWHTDQEPDPLFPHYTYSTHGAMLVDMDSDGWLDVMRFDGADGFFNATLEKNEAGSKGSVVGIAGCFGGCSYDFQDVDLDGDIDMIEDEQGFLWRVFTNDGAGRFRFHSSSYGNGRLVVVGDLNGDEYFDFVDAKNPHGWRNGATGQSHEPGSIPPVNAGTPTVFVMGDPFEIESFGPTMVADLDSDGRSEVIAVKFDSLVKVEFDESGFSESELLPLVERERWEELQTADVDNDGDMDVLASIYDRIFWVENQNGSFQDATLKPVSQDIRRVNTRYWDVGNIDEDTDIDVVHFSRGAGVFGGSTLYVHRFDNGTFRSAPVFSLRDQKTVLGFRLVDVDHDGDLDIHAKVGYWENGRDRVYEAIWLENSEGRFQREQVLYTFPSDVYEFADVNGDKTDDLIYEERGKLWVRPGITGEPILVAEDRDASSLRLVDIDRDGDQDLLAHSEHEIFLVENSDGAGTWAEPRSLAIGRSNVVGVGDADQDLDTDIFVIANGTRRLSILEMRVAGDSNNDGVFDSADLSAAFRSGEYDDGIYRNSTYETGDWNGDGEFDSADLVFVFQASTYSAAAIGREVPIERTIDLVFEDLNDRKSEKRETRNHERQIEV